MAKLSLNQAAKYAGVAKKTLLERLKSNDLSAKLSGEKNVQGHWEIDEAELDRVFRKPQQEPHRKTVSSPHDQNAKTSQSSALEVEVKMLREQIERMDTERERERAQLGDQIEALKAQAERQSADHRQALAALTDQREKAAEPPSRGFFGLLKG